MAAASLTQTSKYWKEVIAGREVIAYCVDVVPRSRHTQNLVVGIDDIDIVVVDLD